MAQVNKAQIEKLKNAIIYFVQQDKTVKLTKLMKLLYYLDFRHYKETGYSVTGQEYVAWRQGPVPKNVWHELRNNEDMGCGLHGAITLLPAQDDDIGFTIALMKGVKLSQSPFSHRESQLLKEVSEMFRGCTAKQVSDASHMRGQPWEKTLKVKGEKARIDYDLALEGCDENHIERIREDQADRFALSRFFGVDI